MSVQGGSFPRSGQPILTLEPFVDAVRRAIEARSWSLSGVQKTTSYEYEGRWAGETTRSAYLFFHPHEGLPAVGEVDAVSLDVFLDETSKGMTGNLALVIEGPELAVGGLFQQDLDFLLRLLQGTLTGPGELDAALEQLQGFLQRQISLFHGLHERFQLGHGAVEIGWCGLVVGHGKGLASGWT